MSFELDTNIKGTRLHDVQLGFEGSKRLLGLPLDTTEVCLFCISNYPTITSFLNCYDTLEASDRTSFDRVVAVTGINGITPIIDHCYPDRKNKNGEMCRYNPFEYDGDFSGCVKFQVNNKFEYVIFREYSANQNTDYFLVCHKSVATELFDIFKKRYADKCASEVLKNPPILDDKLYSEIIDNSINFLLDSSKFKEFGVRLNRGLIFHGMPGNGKTMMCKWIRTLATKHGFEVLDITNSKIQKLYVENELNSTLADADIIFFDDVDISFFTNRKHAGSDAKIASAMLSALDGTNESRRGCVRIFTTNEDTSDIDPAFLRNGRIDKIFSFSEPNADIRRQYIDTCWNKLITDNIDCEYIIKNTEGYSFASLEEIKTNLVQNFIKTGKWDVKGSIKNLDRDSDIKKNGPTASKTTKIGFGAAIFADADAFGEDDAAA